MLNFILDLDIGYRFCIFAFLLILNFINYLYIRKIIWSIVRLESRGSKWRERRKTFKKDIKFIDLVKMNYLTQYIKKYDKDFQFWIKIKRIFVIIEAVLSIAFVFLALVFCRNIPAIVFSIIIMCQTIVVFIILRINVRDNRYTKYDDIRIKLKKKSH